MISLLILMGFKKNSKTKINHPKQILGSHTCTSIQGLSYRLAASLVS